MKSESLRALQSFQCGLHMIVKDFEEADVKARSCSLGAQEGFPK